MCMCVRVRRIWSWPYESGPSSSFFTHSLLWAIFLKGPKVHNGSIAIQNGRYHFDMKKQKKCLSVNDEYI